MLRQLQCLLMTLLCWHADALAQSDFYVTARLEYAHPQLTEMSGLSPSFRQSDVLWAHNDSGDQARLYRLRTDGRVLATVDISNAGAFDWEDMASFMDERGASYLLLADIGDNSALRPFIDVYLVPEPRAGESKTKAIRRYSLFYPDGPRDAEAIAVDSREGTVYLLSKRELYPRLYSFKLSASPSLLLPLTYRGELRSLGNAPPAAARQRRHWKTTVTAMAFSPDLDAAIVVTPGKSFYFPRHDGESWLQTLNRKPQTLTPGRLPQIEAGDFSADGRSIYLGSEGKPARLVVFKRRSP